MKVLLTGPFERDRFLDQLFLVLSRPYFEDDEVSYATPFGSDVRDQLEVDARPCNEILDEESFDVVWTVGGGVGPATIDFAYLRGATAEEAREFARASPADRVRIMQRADALADRIVSPYIPDLALYPGNSRALSVVNSVGLERSFLEPDVRLARREAFSSIDLASARDDLSVRMLIALGVKTTLAPDLVHTVATQFSEYRVQADEPYTLVQVETSTLEVLGREAIAAKLAASDELRGRLIKVLSMSHVAADDMDATMFSRELASLAPDSRVELSTPTTWRELLELVGGASLVISDEQHIRIIACAYGRPRVQLWTHYDKAHRYHSAWDAMMPIDVDLDRIDEAIAQAESRAATDDRSTVLATAAERNMRGLVTDVRAMVRSR